jgi:hypothetical protein
VRLKERRKGGNPTKRIRKAPIQGFVKVNWDAVVDKNKKKMGICVIAMMTPKPYFIDPVFADVVVSAARFY